MGVSFFFSRRDSFRRQSSFSPLIFPIFFSLSKKKKTVFLVKGVDSASSCQLAVEGGRGWAFGSVLVGFRDCGCLLSSLVRSLLVNNPSALFFLSLAFSYSYSFFPFSALEYGFWFCSQAGLQGHENANWPDSHGHVVSLVRGLVPGGS